MLYQWHLVLVSSILCFCFDAASSASQPFFRNDYVFSPETQNFYKFHSSHQKFIDAVIRCKMEGASLLVTETKEERDAVLKLIEATYPKDPGRTWFPVHYMGLHDMFSEGDFITLDAKSIDTVFVEWDTNEPSNSNEEDCVEMRRYGKINDVQCELRIPFICEKSRQSIKWNALCGLPDTEYVYDKELGKCYKLHLEPKDWKTAYATCSAEQSYLAIINDQSEADFFVKMISRADRTGIIAPQYFANAAFLGFHNQFLTGFTTVKGQALKEVGYNRWAAGQPDNAGDERCGSMFFDGGLNDLTCGLSAIFICEHEIDGTSAS